MGTSQVIYYILLLICIFLVSINVYVWATADPSWGRLQMIATLMITVPIFIVSAFGAAVAREWDNPYT